MTVQNTITKRLRFNPLPALQAGAVRLLSGISRSPNTMAGARPAGRQWEFSYEELAARSLSRDRIGPRAVWRYMGY